MARTNVTGLIVGLLLTAVGCSDGPRVPLLEVDCSEAEMYEFLNISDFSGTDAGWFQYADPTPGGVPDPVIDGSNVPVTEIEAPGRCGDTRILRLFAEGHNFWGTGFGDWEHNAAASRADGTGFEGISFWARSPADSEKTFLLNVDDSRTILLPPDPPPEGGLPPATSADQDLDGDGFVGPGDIARETQCRLPPPNEFGEPRCYLGGMNAAPNGVTRVPAPDECGNAFHTFITTTERWQLFRIPWSELVQWPCPNRLDGGIDPSDVAKFEIMLIQGTRYDIWIDNIAFYRRR